MTSDLRLAVRSLGATPAVTLAALLTLALAIGSTTAIFSVGNGLVLRPLPVANPERLVTVTSAMALRYGFQAGAGWNFGMWDELRQRAGVFDGAFAWTLQRLDLSEGGEEQPVNVLLASGEFFSTLGVDAAIGRTFTSADDVRGGGREGPVLVVSHDFWQRRFNGAPGAIGSRLSIEGTPVTIVGVAPPRFRGVDIGQPFDIAIPFGAESVVRGRRSIVSGRGSFVLTVMLRLKPGQTLEEATAALRTRQPEIIPPNAPQFLQEPFVLVPASTGISDRSRLRQQYAYPLVLLSILSGIVLVIACMNIANLFLARAAARRRQLSIRLAVGATRGRVATHVLAEALLLTIAGALAGTLLATWASRALVAQLPAAGEPVPLDLPIDWRVLAFTIVLTTIAVAICATAPALYAMRVAPMEALQEEGRSTSGRRTGVFSGGLLVAQIGLSIVLLTAAGLFVATVHRLANVPLGFDPRVLVITVNPTRGSQAEATPVHGHQRILEAISAVPGVTSAAGSVWTPVGSGGGGILTDARGRRADDLRSVAYNFITPRWFQTFGMALRAGRDFDTGDSATAPRVAIVNESLRRRLLDRDSVGTTIEAGPCGRGGCTVVGVVGDAVYGGSLRDAPPPTVYLPFAQSAGLTRPDAPFRISVRAAGDPVRLAPDLAMALRAVDPAIRFSFRPLETDLKAAVAEERLVARLAGFFGAVALLLSAVGLYGLTSHAVTRRRAEIGIRLALGGQPRTVLQVVSRRIAVFVLAGMLAGVLAALWLSRFAAPLLYGLEPRDPLTLVASTLTLALVAGLAAWLPARRATCIDPARVLREN